METTVLQDKAVLIVDDDPDVVSALRTVFSSTGAIVTTAADGDEAIERAQADAPDLIILDAMLPKRSGFLVLEKLNSSKPRGEKPLIIMITGNHGKRHQEWAESLGVDAYIAKPFRMEKLLQSAESLLGSEN